MFVESDIKSWVTYWLSEAKLKSKPSKDPSTKIGCVVVGGRNQILATGYNGFPRGISDLKSRYEHRPTKYRYVVHAEQNAIYNSCYAGISLKDSTFYVYGLPVCNECSKALIQVGVAGVHSFGLLQDRWKESIIQAFENFEEAGIPYTHYIGDDIDTYIKQIGNYLTVDNYKEFLSVDKIKNIE